MCSGVLEVDINLMNRNRNICSRYEILKLRLKGENFCFF